MCLSTVARIPPLSAVVSVDAVVTTLTTYLADGGDPLTVGVGANAASETSSIVLRSLHYVLLKNFRVVAG